jgi:dTDP-4-dehydrorhamnose reductase
MKIAILGANGFIGSYLCTYLWARNHEVIPITRKNLDLTDADAVRTWLEKNSPDVVINAAIAGGGLTVNDINYADVQNNLVVFFNFYNSSVPLRYINIGSGAEFDRQRDIKLAHEYEIQNVCPKDSYGFSKNIIARTILKKSNFYTLRLFGCFHSSEPNIRLFKRFLSGQVTSIQNKWFDYFSLSDFAKVVDYYCTTESELPADVNCVYNEKYMLNEILGKLNYIKQLDIPIYTDALTHFSYTGSSKLLSMLRERAEFPQLEGLEKGLEQYE